MLYSGSLVHTVHSNLESESNVLFRGFLVFTYPSMNMSGNYDRIEKTLVGLAIEHSLLQVGRPVFDDVVDRLYKKYHLSIPDCYEHPQYLSTILKETLGGSYTEIAKSITKFLSEFRYDRAIDQFIEKIST